MAIFFQSKKILYENLVLWYPATMQYICSHTDILSSFWTKGELSVDHTFIPVRFLLDISRHMYSSLLLATYLFCTTFLVSNTCIQAARSRMLIATHWLPGQIMLSHFLAWGLSSYETSYVLPHPTLKVTHTD